MNNMNIWCELDFKCWNDGFLLSLSHQEQSFFSVVSIVFSPTSYEAYQPVGFELWVMSLELMMIHISEHLVVLKLYKLDTGVAVFFTLHTCWAQAWKWI